MYKGVINMISTLEKDLRIMDGNAVLVPKEYPNWYGIENIGFIWYGQWADPELEYKGKRINSTIVENTMLDRFKEDCEENGISANLFYFDTYMGEHAEDVYELLELAMEKE
jgi:hypothetical protein